MPRPPKARGLLCRADEVNYLAGPGRGVILIKLTGDDDRVLGFIASRGDRDLLTVETSRGAEQTISTAKYEVTGRGGKGRELLQRGRFTRIALADAGARPGQRDVWANLSYTVPSLNVDGRLDRCENRGR